MPRRELRRWAASLALMLPAAIPYAAHFLDQRPYSRPTGYIQADMPLYMAKAREAFDGRGFGLLYGNPCGGLSAEPRIYFQPWTFALGLAHRLTGARPGWLYVAFWFLAAWAATRAATALYEDFVGLDTRGQKLGLVAFLWGGGVLAIAGAMRGWLLRGSIVGDDLTAFDPVRGWWFLNLGRNLVYPTEALYHALGFASFLGAARGQAVRTLILAALTAACSPFAGLEVLAILWLASAVEVIVGADRPRMRGPVDELTRPRGPRSSLLPPAEGAPQGRMRGFRMAPNFEGSPRPSPGLRPPSPGGRGEGGASPSARGLALFLGVNALAAGFFAYYLGYLGRFAEHRLIADQMALPWRYAWASALFAYGPVFAVAAWRFRTPDRAGALLGDPRNRFLICWAVAAVALENHDLILAPRQPIHFTRGYAWSALFLLGAPAWVGLFDRLRRPARLLVLGLLLLDNATWFALFARDFRVPDRNGLRLNAEQLAVLERLDGDDLAGHLLVSADERISYLALSETGLRSWIGHPLETPDYRERRAEVDAFFDRGKFSPHWANRPLVIVGYCGPGPGRSAPGGGREIYRGRTLQILQFAPRTIVATPQSDGRTGDPGSTSRGIGFDAGPGMRSMR